MRNKVRLTERDLSRIVRRVMSEGVDATMELSDNLKNIVSQAGAITRPGEERPSKTVQAQIYYNTDAKSYLCMIGNDIYSIPVN